MFQTFNTISFHSLWYWAFTILVWALVTSRTLGVPPDMVLRARRLPDVAARVDLLAHIAAARLVAVTSGIGVPVAGLVGFGLAMLAGIGFGSGVELAQAVFVLLCPLALVGAATARLARAVWRERIEGAELRRRLARRRMWNQAIAILAMLAASVVGLAHQPGIWAR